MQLWWEVFSMQSLAFTAIDDATKTILIETVINSKLVRLGWVIFKVD